MEIYSGKAINAIKNSRLIDQDIDENKSYFVVNRNLVDTEKLRESITLDDFKKDNDVIKYCKNISDELLIDIFRYIKNKTSSDNVHHMIYYNINNYLNYKFTTDLLLTLYDEKLIEDFRSLYLNYDIIEDLLFKHKIHIDELDLPHRWDYDGKELKEYKHKNRNLITKYCITHYEEYGISTICNEITYNQIDNFYGILNIQNEKLRNEFLDNIMKCFILEYSNHHCCPLLNLLQHACNNDKSLLKYFDYNNQVIYKYVNKYWKESCKKYTMCSIESRFSDDFGRQLSIIQWIPYEKQTYNDVDSIYRYYNSNGKGRDDCNLKLLHYCNPEYLAEIHKIETEKYNNKLKTLSEIIEHNKNNIQQPPFSSSSAYELIAMENGDNDNESNCNSESSDNSNTDSHGSHSSVDRYWYDE